MPYTYILFFFFEKTSPAVSSFCCRLAYSDNPNTGDDNKIKKVFC